MVERKKRLLVLWLLTAALAALDLWVNVFLSTPDWAYHHRSALWAIGCTVLLAAVVPLTRVPSSAVTIGAGVFSGGVLGNLVSGASNHLAVPNPLLLSTGDGGIAFNLADTFIVGGTVILTLALCALVFRNREQLHAGRVAMTSTLRRRPPR